MSQDQEKQNFFIGFSKRILLSRGVIMWKRDKINISNKKFGFLQSTL
jgi:hypothetical protein